MSNNREPNFFWLSYSDLMTSLFFVMLLLFVLSYVVMQKNEIELKKSRDELQKSKDSVLILVKTYQRIQEIEKALTKLDTNFFSYNEGCRRFELKQNFTFPPHSAFIADSSKPELVQAGKALAAIINSLKNEESVKYVVIIEGRIAKKFDGREGSEQLSPDEAIKLSYERSLAVKDLWQRDGVNFDENICEVIIAGSGYYGSCRYEGNKEDYNKRVVIHILPKIRNKMH